jgi:hypothetical protein
VTRWAFVNVARIHYSGRLVLELANGQNVVYASHEFGSWKRKGADFVVGSFDQYTVESRLPMEILR